MDRNQKAGIPVGYTLRVCESHQDLAACVRIQQQVWGYSDAELYPLRLFVNLGQIGGHVLGAFAKDGELVGLVASMPAWRGRQRYLYSLLLGILPEHENRGVGRALKVAQRSAALKAGIDQIEWSFDPLRARNAAFNINRLGAKVRRYEPDRYGRMEGRFHHGLPSDRLIAEWRLDSSRVRRALAGKQLRVARRQPVRSVAIPADIDALMGSDFDAACQCQTRVRKELQTAFAEKLVITGFATDGGSPAYLLDNDEN